MVRSKNIIFKCGTGGMYEEFLTYDIDLDEMAALKILPAGTAFERRTPVGASFEKQKRFTVIKTYRIIARAQRNSVAGGIFEL